MVLIRLNRYVLELETKVRELTAALTSNASPAVLSDGVAAALLPHREAANIATPGTLPSEDAQPIKQSPQEDISGTSETEVADLNEHTRTVEFHGRTSSMAFLGYLQKPAPESIFDPEPRNQQSLISAMHNQAFSPAGLQLGNVKLQPAAYSKVAPVFIEAYFESLHFIHPFIDMDDFKARAHQLWTSETPVDCSSFTVMYLSLMSLGALVKVWDEERIDGLDRFDWSRKLFRDAQDHLNALRFTNDLDTVHALYLMVGTERLFFPGRFADKFVGKGVSERAEPTSLLYVPWICCSHMSLGWLQPRLSLTWFAQCNCHHKHLVGNLFLGDRNELFIGQT